jgi:predicted aspartyl protease
MRFGYSANLLPPGLIIPLRIRPLDTDKTRESWGKIDTGADGTVIPEGIKKDLCLKPRGCQRCWGAFDVTPKTRPTYYITVLIGEELSFDLQVISDERETVLIGRDLLNQIILHADGPSLFFELSQA